MEPVFLTLDEVLALHSDQIRRYGGSPGIRDRGLLSSALGTPSATIGGAFLHQSLFEMAGAYLFHIAQNHPFVDGNKRTGNAAVEVFLLLNGYEFQAPMDEQERVMLQLASGEMQRDSFTDWISSHVVSKG